MSKSNTNFRLLNHITNRNGNAMSQSASDVLANGQSQNKSSDYSSGPSGSNNSLPFLFQQRFNNITASPSEVASSAVSPTLSSVASITSASEVSFKFLRLCYDLTKECKDNKPKRDINDISDKKLSVLIKNSFAFIVNLSLISERFCGKSKKSFLRSLTLLIDATRSYANDWWLICCTAFCFIACRSLVWLQLKSSDSLIHFRCDDVNELQFTSIDESIQVNSD